MTRNVLTLTGIQDAVRLLEENNVQPEDGYYHLQMHPRSVGHELYLIANKLPGWRKAKRHHRWLDAHPKAKR